MELNKKSMAGIGAAAAAFVVLAGGYVVSFANYSSTLEKARIGIEHFVTQSAQVEPGSVSVEFFEPKAGLFSHDVTLVVTHGEDSFKLPMTIGSGYASYSIDLDLVNAKVNQENAIKYLELNDLTKLEAYGKVSLLSGQLNFTSNISFLNNSSNIESYAQAIAFDIFQKEKAQIALEKAKIAKAKKDAQAAKDLEKAKKDALNVTLESNRAKAKALEQEQAQMAQQEQVLAALSKDNSSELLASDQQEIDSVETIKNTPVNAGLDNHELANNIESSSDDLDTMLSQDKDDDYELAYDDLLDEKALSVTYKYDKSMTMDENLAALKKMQEMAVLNDQAKNEARLTALAKQEFNKLIDSLGYKTIGNANVNVVVDSQENIRLSINVDSYHKDGVGFTNLNLFSQNKGVLSLRDIGRTDMSIDKAYDLSSSSQPLFALENALLKLNSSKPNKSGNFSLDYIFKSDKLDNYKYVDVSGTLNGLNIKIFNSDEALKTLSYFIKENGLELKINKGSSYSLASFVRPDKYSDPQNRDIKVSFDGTLAFSKGENFYLLYSMPQGHIDFNFDAPIDLIVDPYFNYSPEIIEGFEIKDGKSFGSVDLKSKNGYPQMLVNGQNIF